MVPGSPTEREFRVFIRNTPLVGISQREVNTFYPILTEKKHDMEKVIDEFYMDKVSMGFESESYTLDVYVRKDMKVKLLDFNPWCEVTLPLLFTWAELESEQLMREPEFRIVESRFGVRPGLKTAVPYGYLDTSEGSGWDRLFRNADEELRRQTRSAGGC
ncbi:putative Cell division cycle protein [Helianthus debilis subsp. tardiflorus]